MLVTSTANMSTAWGCNKTSPDGESLDSWKTSNNLGLLYTPKETASFSHRWNVGTNPDLAFASFGRTADCRTDVLLKSSAVTTSVFPYNATEAQASCPQRSGESLELSQG